MFAPVKRRPERAMARRAFDPFRVLRNEMEGLFDRFVKEWPVAEEWAEVRDWEVNESDKEVTMRLELPGFEAKEIEMKLEGNVCVVRANHPETAEKNGHRHVEIHEYRFTLPLGTDVNAIEAFHRNGVLELHLPRRPEAEPKRIEVKA